MTVKNPIVGDVIVSIEFIFATIGTTSLDGITVPCLYPHHERHLMVSEIIPENERIASLKAGHGDPGKYKTLDLGRYDLSRGQAEFVVEHAAWEGYDNSPRDGQPNSWHIIARRLFRNGLYDRKGEL
ncbi:MAG: hypothetical protein UW80_C0033G0017, partial [Microgenomates group bacterium GW2011_GWC1_44_9]